MKQFIIEMYCYLQSKIFESKSKITMYIWWNNNGVGNKLIG